MRVKIGHYSKTEIQLISLLPPKLAPQIAVDTTNSDTVSYTFNHFDRPGVNATSRSQVREYTKIT